MVTPHFCLQILVETLFSSDAIYQRFTVEIKSRFELVSLIQIFHYNGSDADWYKVIIGCFVLFVSIVRSNVMNVVTSSQFITYVLTEQSALSEHNPDISGILVDCQAWIIDTFSFVVLTK